MIMKIALPIAQEQLCMHFGHCEVFGFFEVDEQEKRILNTEYLTPPQHEPGILPPWIKSQGADVVITGGMGGRAQSLFVSAGVKVVTGAPALEPEEVVRQYLNKTLQTGNNACDH